MSIGDFVIRYAIALAVFLVIDMIWLVWIARGLYKKELGYLMAEKVNMVAAFVFYMIFILGVVVFVVNPAVDNGKWHHALLYGLLFGFVTYSTYDLTNLATVKNWPIKITVIDLIWGSCVSSVTALVTYLLVV